MRVDEFVEEIGNEANELGLEMTKKEWIDACERMADWFKMSAELVREGLKDEVES